jgi:hypothetical protein
MAAASEMIVRHSGFVTVGRARVSPPRMCIPNPCGPRPLPQPAAATNGPAVLHGCLVMGAAAGCGVERGLVLMGRVDGPAEPALCAHVANTRTESLLRPRTTMDLGPSWPTIGTRTSPPFQASSTRRKGCHLLVAVSGPLLPERGSRASYVFPPEHSFASRKSWRERFYRRVRAIPRRCPTGR